MNKNDAQPIRPYEVDYAMEDDLQKLARAASEAVLHKKIAIQDAVSEKEEARLAQEAKIAEEARLAEEARIAAEEAKTAEIQSLKAQLAQKEEEYNQLKDRLLRQSAEFENFKKRSRKERADLVQFANEELIKELLPIFDNFERALESGRTQNIPENFFKGIELIYNQAFNILDKLGLRPIIAVGEPFDPKFHEAVMRSQTSEVPENAVFQEFRRGYTLHEKIIRQAMVSVAARPEPQVTENVDDALKADAQEHP